MRERERKKFKKKKRLVSFTIDANLKKNLFPVKVSIHHPHVFFSSPLYISSFSSFFIILFLDLPFNMHTYIETKTFVCQWLINGMNQSNVNRY